MTSSSIQFPPKEKTPKITPQSTAYILMINPSSFRFNPEAAQDNTFMNACENSEEVTQKGIKEVYGLKKALEENGVVVSMVDNGRQDTPDAIFPNNWVSTHVDSIEDPFLILYSMAVPNRRLERSDKILKELETHYCLKSSFVPTESQKIYLEGTGALVCDRNSLETNPDLPPGLICQSLLMVPILIFQNFLTQLLIFFSQTPTKKIKGQNRTAYLCISHRADETLAREWCQKVGYSLFSFRALAADNKTAIYHTNVMLAVCSKVAIVCLECIPDPQSREDLRSKLQCTHEVVEISMAQVSQFCGNVLEVQSQKGEHLLAMSTSAEKAFTPSQKEVFSRNGLRLVAVDFETVQTVGGGGVRCCLLELM